MGIYIYCIITNVNYKLKNCNKAIISQKMFFNLSNSFVKIKNNNLHFNKFIIDLVKI